MACESRSTPSAATLTTPGSVVRHRAFEHGEGVFLVQQLQAGVVAQDGGDDREREVARDHRVDPRADQAGEAQHGGGDVRPPPGEAAQVALDLGGVAGVPGGGQVVRRHRLVEQRRVQRARAVHRGGRLEHDPPHASAPSGRRRAAASCRGRSSPASPTPTSPKGRATRAACTTVSTSARAITLAISGLRMSARMNSARPMRLQQVRPRRDGVDAEHPLDRRVRGEPRGEVATEEAADTRDEDDRGGHGPNRTTRATRYGPGAG